VRQPPGRGAVMRAPFFGEPVRVVEPEPFGLGWRLAAVGVRSGDPAWFRLGVEALRLGLAYEYDPYFALSVSRVDPLPHQLEAVYQYFLALPRIRFLLADDPGATKTILAGLLLREPKARGLVRRVLVVTPANLMFQRQRELRERFREDFEIVHGPVLRAAYGQNPWQEKDQHS
jgi:hypothetical protein